MMVENEAAIEKALFADLHRHDMESHVFDISIVKEAIQDHIAHLEEWTADSYPEAGFIFSMIFHIIYPTTIATKHGQRL